MTVRSQQIPSGGELGLQDSLRQAAREVVEVAEGILGVSERLTALLSHPGLAASIARHPGTGLRAGAALLRAVTDGDGLGYAVKSGSGLIRRLGQVGEVFGGESLAARVAVSSLRLRVEAVAVQHPEMLRESGLRRLLEAVTADHDLAAARALRSLLKEHGAQRGLAVLAPLLPELSAIRALLDENPLNDDEGWAIATGREMKADPWAGIDARHLADLDSGEGSAERVDLSEQQTAAIATTTSLLGYLGNIATLLNDGRVLVQDVRGPDDVVRHVLHAPGMAPGKPRNDSPQDFVGAWRNLYRPDSPYTRGMRRALEDYGIPDGAEIALIGHSEGGIAVMNLAQDPEFCARYKVTHVVCVGSPIDSKKPADPDTWVATVTNQHDLVTILDGRGAGSIVNPHPDWYEADYVDPTHDFPMCHSIDKYIQNLQVDLPQVREDIDEALTPYHGQVIRSQAYQLKDRAHPPEGYPFMTVPTTTLELSTGPVDTPVRYYDSSLAMAFFTADDEAVARLLPDESWLRPTGLRGRCLVALTAYEHRCTSIGAYRELGLAVLVDDLWRPRRRDVVRDLLRSADSRHTGRFVVALCVSTPEAQTVSAEVWGHPAQLCPMDVTVTGRRLHVALDGPEEGAASLELSGVCGPYVPAPHIDSVLYGRPGDAILRTLVHTRGRLRAHLAPSIRLRLGRTGAHPLAAALRDLGLDGARPRFVISAPDYMARRGAGTALPR